MLLTEYNEAEVMELFMEDGIKKGRIEGRIEGRLEGRLEGCDMHLIKQICKKLEKGKDIATIADEVEEKVEKITPICEVAKKYAPDYDVDAIYNEIHTNVK